MSTVNVLNITDGTTTVTSTTVIRGASKGWINFNGTGVVATRASFNTTSITDNGTGDYTQNYTAAQTDANYAVAGLCNVIVFDDGGATAAAKTASSWRFSTASVAAARTDYANVAVEVFR